MKPAVALPGKNDSVAHGPIQLVRRIRLAISAAGSFSRAPGFLRLAGGHLHHANRPRQRRAMRLKEQRILVGRNAQKSDARGVRRPYGVAVQVGRRIKIRDRTGRRGIDSDEAVVTAITHKSEARSVGRPTQTLCRASRLQQLLWLGFWIVVRMIEVQQPNLTFESVGQLFAVRGHCRCEAALSQQARLAALGAHPPQLLLCTHGEATTIWQARVLTHGAIAANVDDRRGVSAPLHSVYVLAVVVGIARDLSGSIALAIRRGLSPPQVARAADVRHPRQPTTRWSGAQIGRVWGAQSLLNRESLGLGNCRWRSECKDRSDRGSNHGPSPNQSHPLPSCSRNAHPLIPREKTLCHTGRSRTERLSGHSGSPVSTIPLRRMQWDQIPIMRGKRLDCCPRKKPRTPRPVLSRF